MEISSIIQILLIVFYLIIIWFCILSIRDEHMKRKYSYTIVIDLGLVLFLIINIFRQVNLLIVDKKVESVVEVYNNTLESFSYFAYFVLPLILVLAIYSILANITLIIKEGVKPHNLMGILFGILIMVGAYATQFVYMFTKNIGLINSQLYIKRFIDICLNVVLCYFYCITLSALYCNIMAAKHKPKYDKDFVIILGARVMEDGTLSLVLKGRVDKAIEFAKEQKEKNGRNIIFVTSGGKGDDETISEAEAMKNYLVQNGISEENIIEEAESKNTLQNMRFSKKKIEEINKEGNVIFATTNYHVFRSGVIASDEGLICEGIGSRTKWYFYVNAIIREFIANIVSQRKKHLAVIMGINAVIFVLILIGYKYGLIR